MKIFSICLVCLVSLVACNSSAGNSSGGSVTNWGGADGVSYVVNSSTLDNVSVNDTANVSIVFHPNSEVSGGLLKVATSSLQNLPPDWKSSSSNFSCNNLLSSECTLVLSYTPTTSNQSGNFVLNYSYLHGNNQISSASIPIAYGSMANPQLNVSYESSINATIVPGVESITFYALSGTFTKLSIPELANLPYGWRLLKPFVCDSISISNSCVLSLIFQPEKSANGVLNLNLSYSVNQSKSGTLPVNINYSAEINHFIPHNNTTVLSYTISPQLPISFVAKTQGNINIVFAATNGGVIHDLVVTPVPDNLPPYVHGPATFKCDTVAAGNACTLSLIYAPEVANDSGTIQLTYQYPNANGGNATGNILIPYLSKKELFLGSAPIGSTINSIKYCILDSSGLYNEKNCNLHSENSTLLNGPIGFAFNNGYLYISNFMNGVISRCNIDSLSGDLNNCQVVIDGTNTSITNAPRRLAIGGNLLYISNLGGGGFLTACQLNQDGSVTLSNCNPFQLNAPTGGIAMWGTNLYGTIGNSYINSKIEQCTSGNGRIQNCTSVLN